MVAPFGAEYYRGNLSSLGMLRDGDYCLGQTQVADDHSFSDLFEIDKHRLSMSDFRSSKYFKAISDNGFDCGNFSRKADVRRSEALSIFFGTKRLKARKHKRFDCPKSLSIQIQLCRLSNQFLHQLDHIL